MKEDFLHYIWKYKMFDILNLKTFDGSIITIVNSGQQLMKAGPDFFNAQIIIGDQKWAGNVEIHLKSSDWYLHTHHEDKAYDNVILHVVWEHDAEIFHKNNVEIPVLELKSIIDPNLIERYEYLKTKKTWIYCEKELVKADSFKLSKWLEHLFFERLETKAEIVFSLLDKCEYDWEAVLFCLIAKNFGLNTNGDTFMKIALSIPFIAIRKENVDIRNLEAILFGQAGLLDKDMEDEYFKDLKFRYLFLVNKYDLRRNVCEEVQFFKHRPDNFPTIRLSQLAGLYSARHDLFSDVIGAKSMKEVYAILNIATSDYWETHYLFDKVSAKKRRFLSKPFIDLLLINTLIPLKFAYSKKCGNEFSEELLMLLNEVMPEKNAVIDKFIYFGIKPKSAFETQSLLQLNKEYCNKSRCLECAIGADLLK